MQRSLIMRYGDKEFNKINQTIYYNVKTQVRYLFFKLNTVCYL
jgi:hypothetical protein